jgi:hypothetical protein
MITPKPLSPAAQAAKAVTDAIGIPAGSSLYPVATGFPAKALRAVAHSVDWESGDPKFLVLAIAAELDPQGEGEG